MLDTAILAIATAMAAAGVGGLLFVELRTARAEGRRRVSGDLGWTLLWAVCLSGLLWLLGHLAADSPSTRLAVDCSPRMTSPAKMTLPAGPAPSMPVTVGERLEPVGESRPLHLAVLPGLLVQEARPEPVPLGVPPVPSLPGRRSVAEGAGRRVDGTDRRGGDEQTDKTRPMLSAASAPGSVVARCRPASKAPELVRRPSG